MIASETEYTRFNMNRKCKVKPNNIGKDNYILHYARHVGIERATELYDNSLDSDGYMILPLWCAFKCFGSSMIMGYAGLDPNEFYLEPDVQ